jgi:hypothetical protein
MKGKSNRPEIYRPVETGMCEASVRLKFLWGQSSAHNPLLSGTVSQKLYISYMRLLFQNK